MYDLIIIGLGPAGVAAAIYDGREKLQTLVIGEKIGGQSAVSTNIQNWIGTPSLSGAQMAAGLAEHLITVAEDVKVIEGVEITALAKIDQTDRPVFKVVADKSEHQATALLIASGARRRKLAIPGEEKLLERGVSYLEQSFFPYVASGWL